jgi:hypothetical protein
MTLQFMDDREAPFAFDENPAAFDRTRSTGRKSVAHFNPEEREEEERIYREAILRFVEEKRLEDILGQGEIASLQGYARFRTLMHGMLVNTVRVCRRAPRADTKTGIMMLIHFCADNADGLCRLPLTRFAEILNRDVRNIRHAIDDLEEHHEIGVHRSASGNSYWPKIDRVVRDKNPALGWFINAFSEPSDPRGRPRKYQGADAPYFSEETPSTEKQRAQTSKIEGADALHRKLSEASNKRGGQKRAQRDRHNFRSKTPQPQNDEVRI